MADLDIRAIFDAITTHIGRTGWFDRIAGHEPKNAPGTGMTAAMWLARIAPDRERSGLAATAGRVTLTVRLYSPMLAEPQDDIDLDLALATHAVLNRLSTDRTLGGLIHTIDLLGMAAAEQVGGEAGYLSQDGKLYRVMVITVPCLVNDLWEQG